MTENYTGRDEPLAAWERAALGLDPDVGDPELTAMKRIVDSLEVLDEDARGRVLRYFHSRYGGTS